MLRRNVRLLVIFDAVAEAQSVSLAANQLSLTQSAISHALQKLRIAFNDPLFIRNARGIQLTDRAQQLVGPVRQFLVSAEALFEKRELTETVADIEVVLGIDPCLVFEGSTMGAALATELPEVRFRVDPVGDDGVGLLRERRIDIGLWFADTASSIVCSRELYRDRLVVAVSNSHPLAANQRRPTPALDVLKQYPRLTFDAAESLLAARVKALGNDVVARPALRTASVLQAFETLTQSQMISFLPLRCVEAGRRRGFEIAAVEVPVPFRPLICRLYWSKRTDQEPLCQATRRVLSQSLATSGTGEGDGEGESLRLQ